MKVPIKNGSITHQITGKYGASRVIIKPAYEGTGLIAGGAVRALMDVAGIHNVVAKSLGTHNPYNTIRATLDGFSKLKDSESIAKRTNKTEEE